MVVEVVGGLGEGTVGRGGRVGPWPSINGSCSRYSPGILRQA